MEMIAAYNNLFLFHIKNCQKRDAQVWRVMVVSYHNWKQMQTFLPPSFLRKAVLNIFEKLVVVQSESCTRQKVSFLVYQRIKIVILNMCSTRMEHLCICEYSACAGLRGKRKKWRKTDKAMIMMMMMSGIYV